jgi:putative two-component system response regulator
MKKVLLVDDNELNITILLNALGDFYDVSVALSGAEALEAIKDELPDIIVLDIYMDDISGIDVCKKVKNEKNTKHIPIIFLTAAHEALREIASEAGADDFMGKPIEGAMLRSKIKRLLYKNHIE